MVAVLKRKTVNEVEETKARLPLTGLYLNDDITRSTIAPILGRFGYQDDPVKPGDIDAAITDIANGFSPDLLFVDLGDRPDPRSDIQALADVCPPGTVVVALGTHNDVTLYRDLIQIGVQDYLLKPISADMFEETLDGALTALEEDETAPEIAEDLKRMVVVTSVRGGLGASTLASNLAWLYASQPTGSDQGKDTPEEGHPTILVDMDLVFGTDALQFDLEPGRGLIDALLNPGRVDGLFVDRAALKARENLSILAAEAPLNGIDGVQADAYDALFDALNDSFQTIVVDQPRATLAQNSSILARASDVVVLTDHSLAGARDCIRLCGFLDGAAPGATIHVVASEAGIGPAEVEGRDFTHSIEKELAATLPHDPKACLLAAQKGKVLADAVPASKLVHAINALKVKIDPADDIHKRPSLFAKWLGLKG